MAVMMRAPMLQMKWVSTICISPYVHVTMFWLGHVHTAFNMRSLFLPAQTHPLRSHIDMIARILYRSIAITDFWPKSTKVLRKLLNYCVNPFHTKSIFLEFVHSIMGWLHWSQPILNWMDKFKKNLLLGPSEHLSVKYSLIFSVFMKLFPKMSDITQWVSSKKWIKRSIICVIILAGEPYKHKVWYMELRMGRYKLDLHWYISNLFPWNDDFLNRYAYFCWQVITCVFLWCIPSPGKITVPQRGKEKKYWL